jgi:hypothetical protein
MQRRAFVSCARTLAEAPAKPAAAPAAHAPAATTKASPTASIVPDADAKSVYKNTQHHAFGKYTYADLDVLMANMRMPQPAPAKQ